MAEQGLMTATQEWSLRMTGRLWAMLQEHLFPGDGEEHGAVLRCGIVSTGRGVRLLVKDVILARDGIDYVPGKRGHRMLTAAFVMDQIDRCAQEGLVYLAVHCHGGTTSVGILRNRPPLA